MDIYLVGGAVRDRLLGLAPGDNDFVVVGETPDTMLAAGFKPVGRDFPVFLHPQTNEEHALARTERKSGRGHRGFVVDADPSVTLEEDLGRRDFTINAIAQDADGNLVDPLGGARDIQARVLRHVGPAFVEDPLRVLRAARFMARFAPLRFTVAPETMALMRQMSASGELDALVPERVWQELSKALAAKQPSAFIRTLHDCGALAAVLPEVEALYGVPQRPLGSGALHRRARAHGADATDVRVRRTRRAGARAGGAGTVEGARREAAVRLHPHPARLRRAGRGAAGSRGAVRRAAAPRIPSRSRHRRPRRTGLRHGRATRARRHGDRLRRADPRPGQGADPRRRTAAPRQARTARPRPAARAVRTDEGADRASRTGADGLPRAPQRAPPARTARHHRARPAGPLRRLPQTRPHRAAEIGRAHV